MELVVAKPLVGERIELGMGIAPPKALGCAETHVIDQDDDDVRRALGRRDREPRRRLALRASSVVIAGVAGGRIGSDVRSIAPVEDVSGIDCSGRQAARTEAIGESEDDAGGRHQGLVTFGISGFGNRKTAINFRPGARGVSFIADTMP